MIHHANHWWTCPDCSDTDVTVAGYSTRCWVCDRPMPGPVWKPPDPLPCTRGAGARDIIG